MPVPAVPVLAVRRADVVQSAGDEASGELQVPAEARAERLARRVAALERQVEARIEQIEDLKRLLLHAENLVAAARQETAAAKLKGAEYDALMRTFTMRALRLPRGAYGMARRLVTARRR